MSEAPALRIVADTRCTLCGKVLWYGEIVHENENQTEFMCSNCYDNIQELADTLAPQGTYLSLGEADALARRWAAGETSPSEFDPRIQWWQSEEAVDEAIRLGYVHRKQRDQEIERRRGSGQFRKEPRAFIDEYPMKGYGKNEGFKDGGDGGSSGS